MTYKPIYLTILHLFILVNDDRCNNFVQISESIELQKSLRISCSDNYSCPSETLYTVIHFLNKQHKESVGDLLVLHRQEICDLLTSSDEELCLYEIDSCISIEKTRQMTKREFKNRSRSTRQLIDRARRIERSIKALFTRRTFDVLQTYSVSLSTILALPQSLITNWNTADVPKQKYSNNSLTDLQFDRGAWGRVLHFARLGSRLHFISESWQLASRRLPRRRLQRRRQR